MDLLIFFGIGFIGVVIVLLGFVAMIGRRITESKEETQDKINQLEKEIENLKHGKHEHS